MTALLMKKERPMGKKNELPTLASVQNVAAVETTTKAKREFALHTSLVEVTLQETTSHPRQSIQGWLCREDAEILNWYFENLQKENAELNDGRFVRTEFDAIRFMLQDIRKNIKS